jgi:hypothetical protein
MIAFVKGYYRNRAAQGALQGGEEPLLLLHAMFLLTPARGK